MRISLNWLKDYLDIKTDISIAQIADSLTLAGLEVEAITELKDRAQTLLLAAVEEISPIKDEKAVYMIETEDGIKKLIGPKSNVVLGSVVAFLPSEEMDRYYGKVATFADLGLPQGAEVIVFDKGYFEEIPKNLSLIKEFDDVIFTLGITPNRADALSHLGVSRELSALLDLSARSPMLTPKEMAGPTHEKVAIEIENADDCPRYACRIIENVTVKESPWFIKLRLLSAGIRPVNSIVDITNFVMLSRGQPMHAFDFDRLNKENSRAKIIVRRALENEKLKALNGQELELTPDDVVIADIDKPLALAGIIGGEDSSVTSSTTTILLESAFFEPKNVRKSAKHHDILTDSSFRFERGCDPNGVLDSLNYAARLISESSSAKVCREAIDAYRKRVDPQEIKMRPERAQAILGMDSEQFDQDLLRKRFLRLGIETIAKRGDAIYFRVPTHRFDLSREIDLIEEAARMLGYDKVKESYTRLSSDMDMFRNEDIERVAEKTKNTLTTCGFFEVVNYAFLNKAFQEEFISYDDENLIEIRNPLSDRYGVMRMSLVPGLIKNLLHNQRNQEKSIALFELGAVFLGPRLDGKGARPDFLSKGLHQDSYAHEKTMIAGVLAGKESYLATDHLRKPFDFYHLKGVLCELFSGLGLRYEYPEANVWFSQGADVSYLHPGESSKISVSILGNKVVIGHFGKLHPQIAQKLEVLFDTYIFELDLALLSEVSSKITKFKPFSRFPSIERDVALLVDEGVNVETILSVLDEVNQQQLILSSVNVFDIYRGKNIEAGKKSIGLSFILKNDDRTLTDEEAESFINAFIERAGEKAGAKVR